MDFKKFEFDGLGTRWRIMTKSSPPGLKERLHGVMTDFEDEFSRFREGSVVDFCRKAGEYAISNNGLKLMDFYFKMYRLTEGQFTPLIGGKLEENGYGRGVEVGFMGMGLGDVLEYFDGRLVVKKGCCLDFGAAGKGRMVDILGEVLEKMGVKEYVVDGGGDFLVKGRKLRVGMEDPEDEGRVIGVVEVEDSSICGSAGNRRKWVGKDGKEMHHILDPLTGRSTDRVLATWVIAPCAMVSDGIATALFLVEPEVICAEFEFEYFVLYPDYSFKKSKGFNYV